MRPSMMAYEVFEIPLPPSETHIAEYRNVRLKGLKTNPESFGSTYEREIALTQEQWHDRLLAFGRKTFLAHTVPNVATGEKSGNQEELWVGTLSVLTPEMLANFKAPIPASVSSDDWAVYALVGMWVDPDHRRQGVGKMLVDAAAKSVREIISDKQKVLLLDVREDNMAARDFYAGLGFKPVDGNSMILTIDKE